MAKENIKVYKKLKIDLSNDNKEDKYEANISIVIPLYNQGIFLEEAVKSIISQIIHPMEIIIVDDKSVDDSLVIAYGLKNKYNNIINITIIEHDTNKGVSKSRNDGISISKGNWIICLDADDYIEDNYISEIYKTQKLTKADIIYTDCIIFGMLNNKLEYKRYNFSHYHELILRIQNNMVSAACYRKLCWSDVSGYETRLSSYEDYHFWLKIAMLDKGYKYKFQKCETTGYYYRRHDNSVSSHDIYKKDHLKNYKIFKETLGNFYLGKC